MDKVGPICRTVEDCAMVFDEILGADPLDATSVDGPTVGAFQGNRKLKRKRIGIVREEFSSITDPEVTAVFQNTLKSLESVGFSLEDVKLDDYPYQDIARYTLNIEAATVFEPLWKTGKIDMLLNQQRAVDWSAARLLPATDYLKMQRLRAEICENAGMLFKKYAALVSPAMTSPGSRRRPSSGTPRRWSRIPSRRRSTRSPPTPGR